MFNLLLFILWFSPLISFFIVKKLKLKFNLNSRFSKYILGYDFLILLAFITDIYTSSVLINWIFLSLLYFEICFFIWIGIFSDSFKVKIISSFILPFVFGSGYLVSTFGVFVIAENIPEKTQRINSSIVFKEYNTGNMTSIGGIKICLYKNYKYFPFFEMKFFEKEYIYDPKNEYINKIYPENSKINNKPSFEVRSFKVKYDSLKNEVILQSDNDFDTLHLNEPY